MIPEAGLRANKCFHPEGSSGQVFVFRTEADHSPITCKGSDPEAEKLTADTYYIENRDRALATPPPHAK